MTTSKGFVVLPSEVGLGILEIIWCCLRRIRVVFACVNRWCVRGASPIWDGAVGVVNVCLVSVGVVTIFSALVLKMLSSCCNALPCHPGKVWFYLIIFWIARIRVIAVRVASYIGVSVGMLAWMFIIHLCRGCEISTPYSAHTLV